MHVTARQVIVAAMQKIGVLPAYATSPSADQGRIALQWLNDLTDAYRTENLLQPFTARQVFTLTASVGTYTLGPSGATLTGERPGAIVNAAYLLPGSTREYPLDVLTPQRYVGEADKGATASAPDRLFYQPTVPNGTIQLFPVPTLPVQLVLYVGTGLTQWADLDTVYVFPDGYKLMFQNALAVALSPIFQVPVSTDVDGSAANSYARIKNQHAGPPEMTCDPFLLSSPGGINPATGEEW